jgi:5-methylcytosine-specific restriction endonuclease McrA
MRKYLRYLQSEHWKQLRRQAFERDGYKCVRCGSGHAIQGHHTQYKKNLRKVPVEWIETLCRDCHDEHHKEQKSVIRERRLERAEIRDKHGHLTWLICAFDAR